MIKDDNVVELEGNNKGEPKSVSKFGNSSCETMRSTTDTLVAGTL
jgi:hypothetical protein